MASKSELTFGARLFRAEQMSTNVTSFPAYAPLTQDGEIPAYNALITEINDNNTLATTTLATFSLAVDHRQRIFTKDPDSLAKILTLMLSYITARFGKTSKQAHDVRAIINKIRGVKAPKLKKDEEGEFVSQSEKSYGSQTQHLMDLIAIFTSYGADFAPTNPLISIVALKARLQALNAANTAVTVAFAPSKMAKDFRKTQYANLSKRSQTIKETVKSQYGVQSTEYKLIKGYKI